MKRREPTHSEDLQYEASSSSTSPHEDDNEGGTKRLKGNDYELFLSFRGKDTRKGFTDYLYTSLVDAGIYVFRDDNELRVGEEIGPELLCSITLSKISIPIISKDYAFSKWCLHELAQMLKCRRSRGQVVLPIFYKVEPSQVPHLMEGFGDAINAHNKNLDQMVLKEWKDALEEVSHLKGWESNKIDNGHEAGLVKMVVRRVMSELKRLFQLNIPEQLVGADNRVEQIMSKIDARFKGTWFIGIYGMGGIGKTTLAKILYNKLSSRFENRSFVANIRETCQRRGIECLQKQLISDLGSSWKVSNVDDGISVLESRFKSKIVLALLDDIDDNTHLNALVGDGSWFGVGSIVIITTRDKGVLDKARANQMYPLNELPSDQSLILFSRHAFRKDFPPSDYKDISYDVVSTTGGLPLALEVIGSFLCGKTKEAWKDTSKKLKKVLEQKVQEVLRISYDALNYEEQQIFLDIACFFIGESKQNPIYMWDACDFFPGRAIEVLSLRSLIKVDEHGKLIMHDQLRDLGREIVRQENPKEPQNRSRLWNREEVTNVLACNEGTGKIEALRLDNCYGESYRAEQFKELTSLRFLEAYGVNLTGDFQNLLPQLRWLDWMHCPLDFKVANLYLKKLAVLDLSYSEISEHWGGWGPLKMATELKVLNLSHCDKLRRTPDLSAFKSLEILILEYCQNLEKIHPSTWYIKTLVSLKARECRKLKELPARVHPSIWYIKTLVSLKACECWKLKELPARVGRMEKSRELPESMGSLESLTQLDLRETKIEELPESIGSMKVLETLDAAGCESLARIPSSIGNLASLSLLNLKRCYSLREIPDSIGKLALLTELQLGQTSITKLPESIGNLQNLRILILNYTLVTELPSAIGMLAKLQVLDATRCENLKGLPSNIGELVSLKELCLGGSGIGSLPESISKLSSLQRLSVVFCENLGEIPEPPSSLTALEISFPTPSLPYLSKLTLLQELCLYDRRPLECLPELPARLSKLRLLIDWSQGGEELINDWYTAEALRVSELIRDKSSGLRKVTKVAGGFWLSVDIDEAFPDSPEATSQNVSELLKGRRIFQLKMPGGELFAGEVIDHASRVRDI